MAGWMDIRSIVPYHRPLVVAAQGPYGTRHMKSSRLLPLLSLLALMSLALAVSVGSTSLRFDTVLTAVAGVDHHSLAPGVILGLRLPRALNPLSTCVLLLLAPALLPLFFPTPLPPPSPPSI